MGIGQHKELIPFYLLRTTSYLLLEPLLVLEVRKECGSG